MKRPAENPIDDAARRMTSSGLEHEPAGGSPISARGGDAALARLERLAKLRDRGILTSGEFEEQKREILAE